MTQESGHFDQGKFLKSTFTLGAGVLDLWPFLVTLRCPINELRKSWSRILNFFILYLLGRMNMSSRFAIRRWRLCLHPVLTCAWKRFALHYGSQAGPTQPDVFISKVMMSPQCQRGWATYSRCWRTVRQFQLIQQSHHVTSSNNSMAPVTNQDLIWEKNPELLLKTLCGKY